jgi:hypothetical protein
MHILKRIRMVVGSNQEINESPNLIQSGTPIQH